MFQDVHKKDFTERTKAQGLGSRPVRFLCRL